MADNTTPRGFLTYPDQGDESWYSEDASGQGLEDWLAAIELFGVPTYATFSDLPAAGTPETNGEQRQFAAVVGDRTVYRTDGTEWVPWFGGGTDARPLPGTTHLEALSTEDLIIGSGGTFTEDSASPVNESGTQEISVSLGETHDIVVVRVQEFVNDQSNSQELHLRVDGNTSSNYVLTRDDGTSVTGTSEWNLTDGTLVENYGFSGLLVFRGTGGGRHSVTVLGNQDQNNGLTMARGLLQVNDPGSLSSIQFRGGNGNVSVTGRVYGWSQ